MRTPLPAAWSLLRASVDRFVEDDAPSLGAALAYYTVFSLAPLLLIVIAVAGLVFGQDAARAEVLRQLGALLGPGAAQTIASALAAGRTLPDGWLAALAGGATLLVGATSVFAQLQAALDRIWRTPDLPHGRGAWPMLRTRLLSFGLVLALGFLLLVSLLVSAALAAFGRWWSALLGDWVVVAHALDVLLSFVWIALIIGAIYKWMPRAHVAWRDVVVGALVTSALFTLGKSAIGLYLGHSALASTFGAAASVVVLLLWVYWSAQIFLLGAEFTWLLAQRRSGRWPLPAPPRP